MPRKKITEVNDNALRKELSMSISEIGKGDAVEVTADQNVIRMKEMLEREAFMNEVLTIIVHPASDEGALDIITPAVNAVNQPIIRGIESKVKRKYVEALARGRTTKYTQKVIDSSRPENIQMEARTFLTYPFAVIHDPNPRGRDWLRAIVEQI